MADLTDVLEPKAWGDFFACDELGNGSIQWHGLSAETSIEVIAL